MLQGSGFSFSWVLGIEGLGIRAKRRTRDRGPVGRKRLEAVWPIHPESERRSFNLVTWHIKDHAVLRLGLMPEGTYLPCFSAMAAESGLVDPPCERE